MEDIDFKEYYSNLYKLTPERVINILKKENSLKPSEILKTPTSFFLILGLNEFEIENIRTIASKSIFKSFLTPSELKDFVNPKLTFGCSSLDNLTNGGIKCLGITEISGESGSGKTQICMQLALNVQLPEHLGGLNKSAMFINTEKAFSTKRLYQMIYSIKQRFTKSDIANIDFSNNIFIKDIVDHDKLLSSVVNDFPILINSKNIGLIVIDSIGSIFRYSTETNAIKRANDMRNLIHNLILLSNKYVISVICINQMSSVFNDDDIVLSSGFDDIVSSSPCLGLAWSNLIRTRLILSRFTNSNKLYTRQMNVDFAPDLLQNSAIFHITSDGIVD